MKKQQAKKKEKEDPEVKQIQNVVLGFPEKELPSIYLTTVPHEDQRYETCGDYEMIAPHSVVIKASRTRPHYEFLVLLHEFIEWYLVHCDGLDINKIDEFDKRFEKMRTEYPDIIGDDEPGDNEKAPYYHYHQIATRIEKYMADLLKVNWQEYEEEINKLSK